MLLKKNYESSRDLAKLLILLSNVTVPDMRYKLMEIMQQGAIKEAVAVQCDRSSVEKITSLFNRLGISASLSEDGQMLSDSPSDSKEIPFVISNKKVWVSAESADKLNENLSKIKELSPQLQWKNAQRQIKDFSDDEEEEFMDLQKKYLDLLKEQDEILKEFFEEEKLAVKLS